MKSVISCDRQRPPMITRPRGLLASALAPIPRAIGNAPKMAAKVVIMIGRKRVNAASYMASREFMPLVRMLSKAKSIIMIPFFLTMPISKMMPRYEYIDKGKSKIHSVNNPPKVAGGKVESTVIGCMKLS